MTSITIIGAGFSGTMTAVHLLRNAAQPIEIRLIDKTSSHIGRGTAYSATVPCQLLNVPASNMSAFPDAPEDFLTWARASDRLQKYAPWVGELSASTFLPRALYGEYLSHLLRKEVERCAANHRIEVINDEIVDLETTDAGVRVQSLNRGSWLSDACVLAVGNFPPQPPAEYHIEVGDSVRYHFSPWAPEVLPTLAASTSCLFIGSGLTMLDQVTALYDQGYTGLIHVVSRRGFMPKEHIPSKPARLTHILPSPAGLRDLVRWIRDRIELEQEAGGDWRSVIDGLRPNSAQIWQGLTLRDKKRFLQHVRPYWENHRHRTAAPVLSAFKQMLASGQLTQHRARIENTAIDAASGVRVTLRKRNGAPHDVVVEHVVNCTGAESNFKSLRNPLTSRLLSRGLVTVDELGLGLVTTASGQLIDSGGKASDRLFTLGPPMKGRLWETTAVPELRVQAMQLASRLLSALKTSAVR
ncbi:FAD/NAD(P)-binding protein [Achromobacter sp. UBA2119]|uniref:FAD/NAD(P)-binding protein n=1 Tax=Achromobacter sp. UBA2119 TaxID=1945911 RepID=UPI00257D3246|nr:FAD/NAD(P)-binding protein [Achromobacter sp. UBA2119]